MKYKQVVFFFQLENFGKITKENFSDVNYFIANQAYSYNASFAITLK